MEHSKLFWYNCYYYFLVILSIFLLISQYRNLHAWNLLLTWSSVNCITVSVEIDCQRFQSRQVFRNLLSTDTMYRANLKHVTERNEKKQKRNETERNETKRNCFVSCISIYLRVITNSRNCFVSFRFCFVSLISKNTHTTFYIYFTISSHKT